MKSNGKIRSHPVCSDHHIRSLVQKTAPSDVDHLPTHGQCASLLIPFNCRDPFNPLWDDGGRDILPVAFLTRFLIHLSQDHRLIITMGHCQTIWSLFELTRTKMTVTKQNSLRVLFTCTILAMKWLEDEMDESISEFMYYLPDAMYSKIVYPSMASAMESVLFVRILQCRIPFTSFLSVSK